MSDPVATIEQAIRHRRSLGIARVKPDPVEDGLVWRALEAANWAPSHADTEPWRFVVYTGAGRRALGDAFAEAYRQDAGAGTRAEILAAHRQRALNVPVWIALGMEAARLPDGALRMRIEEEFMACACAVQNLHLVASAQGLAGMWLSKGVFVHPRTASFCGFDAPHRRLLGFFILGWPNIPWPEGERRPLCEKVRWVADV